MRGFDPIYTDIVDYIVRCTHRIWDERDVGLIYTHYTHNSLRLPDDQDALHPRGAWSTTRSSAWSSLPERRGMATQVIWSGNDHDGFYTSHLVTGYRAAHAARPLRAADRQDLHLADHRRLHGLREQDLPRMDRRRHDGDPEAARASTRIRSPSGWRAGISKRGCWRSTSARTGGWSGSIRRRPSRTSRSPRPTSSARRCAGCTRCSTSGCSARSRTSTRRR